MEFEETFETLDELNAHTFKEISIKNLTTSQAAMSYHNRLHAMYVDNRQTGKLFSKQWVIDKHRALVMWMKENGWTHPKRGDNLDKTVEVFGDVIPFDESGLKEGKEILILEIGRECSSADGKERTTVTDEMCSEIERNYNAGHHPGLEKYGAPIDADHELISLTAKEPVKNPTSLDRIFGYVGAKVRAIKGKGLAVVTPLWNDRAKRALEIVKRIGASAAFGPYHAKRGEDAGKKIGYTLYNFSLVANPQQGTLTLGPEMLREMFSEFKAEDIYISKPIEINFEEDDPMSEEKKIEFSEKVTEFLGENPDEKVDEMVALTEEKKKLEDEKTALDEKIKELEKRPALSEHESVIQRLSEVEETLNEQKIAERQRIALDQGKMSQAQMKTEKGMEILDPRKTTDKAFKEWIDNATPVDESLKGTDSDSEEETFADAATELKAKVDKVMQDQNVDRDRAESIVFAENPGLMDRYIKESAKPKGQ